MYKIILFLFLFIFIQSCNDTPDLKDVDININLAVMKHSHNDYATNNPLYGALKAGCQIVEADIILSIDDRIVLSHDKKWYTETLINYGTLEDVYLRPMKEICKERGYDLYLFVEFKDGSPDIKDILHDLFVKYQYRKLHYIIGGWDFDGLYPERKTLFDAFMYFYSDELMLSSWDIFVKLNNVTTVDL